jgi:hypothetical protein
MSKIPKESEKEQKLKLKYKSDENFAFRSVIVSAIFAGIFFSISLFFNTEFISFFMNRDVFWTSIDILIKVLAIIFFFLFMLTSIGNYKELIGKPLNWKELLLLVLLSLGQTILNVFVFIFTFIGIAILLIYLYLIQE